MNEKPWKGTTGWLLKWPRALSDDEISLVYEIEQQLNPQWEQRIAEAVAAEREACAEFAQDWLQQKMFYNTRPAKSPELLAAAIRAGTEEKEK